MSLRIPAFLLALVLLATAGCSSDDPEDPGAGPSAATEAVTPAPDEETVLAAVRDAVRLRKLPDETVPSVDFVSRDNALIQTHQACVLGYLAVERGIDCLLGDVEGGREVVLWGDVRAAQWIPALDRLGREEGWRVRVRVKYGCPPLVGVALWLPAEERPYVECTDFNARALSETLDARPAAVLVAGALRGTVVLRDGAQVPLGRPAADNGWRLDRGGNDLWQDGLARTLDELSFLGTNVVVLGDTPYPGHDAQQCLARHRKNVRACSVGRGAATHGRPYARSSARTAERYDATFVDTVPWFCHRKECPAVIDDVVVYKDGFSVGRQYSTYVSTVLGRAASLIG